MLRLAPILLLLALPAHAQEFIRVASFNIAEFGEGSHPTDHRDLDFIADMLVDGNLDLIAIQEVGTVQGGASQVAALVTRMNALDANDPDYFSAITPQLFPRTLSSLPHIARLSLVSRLGDFDGTVDELMKVPRARLQRKNK